MTQSQRGCEQAQEPLTPACRRLVLVGFMGSGKSTVGPLLAGLLGWSFRDLDAWIEAQAGRPIADIFRDQGEAAFREMELQAALAAQGLESCVLAAGGGAFAFPQARALLQAGALTVWLKCRLEVIIERVGQDPSRPLATDRERMQRLLREREPFYAMTDLTVDTSSSEPTQVAQLIRRLALAHGPSNA